MTETEKYRLLTRPDFDGVVCGTLFKELEIIDDVAFAEPREMQAGSYPTTSRDITANLPYVEGVHLCFDHHVSEVKRIAGQANHIIDAEAPSAARVVYRHYGGKDAFPLISDELLDAVDKADAAQYTEEEILAPEGFTLLNFILDGRTGLGRFSDFAVSKEQLMIDMMTYCRHHPVGDILEIPDVHERIAAYFYEKEFAEIQIRDCATVVENAIVVDLRDQDTVYSVNRFLVYALYPECNVSVHLTPLAKTGQIEIAVGKSILDRGLDVNIGELLLEYGGGGHTAVGTCRAEPDQLDATRDAILARLTAG